LGSTDISQAPGPAVVAIGGRPAGSGFVDAA